MSKLRDAAQQALGALETVLSDAYHRRFPECCGRPGIECCGNPNEAWTPEDNKIMDLLSPVHRQLSDALRAALAEQPAEQEPVEIEMPEYHSHGMGCGLEDRGITDRYEAMEYGWYEAIDRVKEELANFGPLYTAPQPRKQPLTREEIFEIADPFGEFQYGDAQGHKRIDFANAIIAAYERKNGVQT